MQAYLKSLPASCSRSKRTQSCRRCVPRSIFCRFPSLNCNLKVTPNPSVGLRTPKYTNIYTHFPYSSRQTAIFLFPFPLLFPFPPPSVSLFPPLSAHSYLPDPFLLRQTCSCLGVVPHVVGKSPAHRVNRSVLQRALRGVSSRGGCQKCPPREPKCAIGRSEVVALMCWVREMPIA